MVGSIPTKTAWIASFLIGGQLIRLDTLNTLQTANCKTSDISNNFVTDMLPHARESIQHLDLLVWLPITNAWPVEMEDDGIRPIDLPSRDDVDAIVKQICREQRVGVMNDCNAPVFIEL